MKKCGYCGRENDDPARTCCGCGTDLAEERFRELPRLQWDWLWKALRLAALLLLPVLLYLLSFGPVVRFSGKITSSTNVPGGPGGMVHTVTVTVKYPGWVGVLYYPAFWLCGTEWARGYGAYVHWWEERRESD